MPERYYMVTWPELLKFKGKEGWSRCIMCKDVKGHHCPDLAYMVPEDLYNKVYNHDNR